VCARVDAPASSRDPHTPPAPFPRHVAGAITPVPGGVGPMTIAMLLKNTLNLTRHSLGLPRIPLRRTKSMVN